MTIFLLAIFRGHKKVCCLLSIAYVFSSQRSHLTLLTKQALFVVVTNVNASEICARNFYPHVKLQNKLIPMAGFHQQTVNVTASLPTTFALLSLAVTQESCYNLIMLG